MPVKNKKIKTLDLFAGCGGLTEGFEMAGFYETIAAVEWDKPSRNTLVHRLRQRWGYEDAEDRVLLYDIQKTKELLEGWGNNSKYSSNIGLNALVKNRGGFIDLIVGGPPCQAYSVAGRIRDEDGMNNDYRNFLFENYASLVRHFQPHAFVFENVPGMLSARPGGIFVVDKIKKVFSKIGYSLIDDLNRYALVDAADYGVPQNRKRLVLLGIRNNSFAGETQGLLKNFYTRILPAYKNRRITVAEAIFDLPKLEIGKNKEEKRYCVLGDADILNHVPRYHNERDRDIFRELALDAMRTNKKYGTVEKLKRLYTKKTGKTSSIHKYYVLEADKQSNTIVSHLHKDGLRHIHPDPNQARSITVREAARLQSFPDDFAFLGSIGNQYKMVGNAVPPLLAKAIALSVASFLFDNLIEKNNIDIQSWKIPLGV
ncbi:MAG: DNA cytosine methyltransferase [Candidatus Wolfebacteria bacterium]|nr:DNA cytosine methyltransferase [Candidatus Wolfebacteria bacterium]